MCAAAMEVCCEIGQRSTEANKRSCAADVLYSDVGYIKEEEKRKRSKEAAIKRRRASARDEWATAQIGRAHV